MIPIPGCSGVNDGGKYCINPKYEGADSNIAIDSSLGEDAYISFGSRLGLCEGNCGGNNGHCKEGLECFQSNDEPVPGCTGIPSNGYYYCIYPQLNQTSVNNVLNNDGAFLRIGDNGTLTVYSADGNSVIWDTNGNGVQNGTTFDPLFDISLKLANQLSFAGLYRHSEMNFDFDSDTSEGGFHVDDGSIELFFTTSIAYKLAASYPVKSWSRLSFDVTLGSDIKAVAICVDDDVARSRNSTLARCLAIGGTDIEGTFGSNIIELEPLAESHTLKTFDIALKDLFPSRLLDIHYIGIMQVVNEGSTIQEMVAPSLIQNINFYEVTPEIEQRFLVSSDNDACAPLVDSDVCASGCLAATNTPGLHYTILREEGDFCTNSNTVLTQIEKDENEPCSFDNECRSGICQNLKCHSRVSHIYLLLKHFGLLFAFN